MNTKNWLVLEWLSSTGDHFHGQISNPSLNNRVTKKHLLASTEMGDPLRNSFSGQIQFLRSNNQDTNKYFLV